VTFPGPDLKQNRTWQLKYPSKHELDSKAADKNFKTIFFLTLKLTQKFQSRALLHRNTSPSRHLWHKPGNFLAFFDTKLSTFSFKTTIWNFWLLLKAKKRNYNSQNQTNFFKIQCQKCAVDVCGKTKSDQGLLVREVLKYLKSPNWSYLERILQIWDQINKNPANLGQWSTKLTKYCEIGGLFPQFQRQSERRSWETVEIEFPVFGPTLNRTNFAVSKASSSLCKLILSQWNKPFQPTLTFTF